MSKRVSPDSYRRHVRASTKSGDKSYEIIIKVRAERFRGSKSIWIEFVLFDALREA